MALVATTVSNSSLLNIVKAQVVFLLSTLTEDTYERKKAEIRDLCDRHGAEIHVHLLRRLIAASHLRLNLDDPTTSFYDPRTVLTFLLLVQETQRLARDPFRADLFREAIDKADGQIFLNFDLDRFCERIGLGPLEKLVLASSIISPFTTRRDLVGQASELIQSNFDKSVALLNKTPSFDLDDLSNSAIEKLLSHLVSDSPLMPSILDVQQRHRIISNVQYKIGTEAMGEILEKISSTLRLSTEDPVSERETSSPRIPDNSVFTSINSGLSSLKYHPVLAKFGILSQDQLSRISQPEAQRLLNQMYDDLQEPTPYPDVYSEKLKLVQDLCSHLFTLPAALEVKDIIFDRKSIIGAGGEAIIYSGSMGNLNVVVREVLIHPREWTRPLGRKLIQLVHREAITHSQLRHPNILPFLGVYHEMSEAPPIVILPFCDDGSLQDLLYDELLMEVDKFNEIVIGITRGVQYLHSRSPPTIHGDLHPGNVLLNKDGNPYLCDFGLSRIRHEVTRTHTVLREGGKIRFLAPELSSGSGEEEGFHTTRESDIFGLAMTFFNVWTGKQPFSEIAHEQKVRSNLIKGRRPERPESTVDLSDDVNISFWNLLEDMWVQEPEKRPSSATVLKRLEDPQGYAAIPTPPPENSADNTPLETAMNNLNVSSTEKEAGEIPQHVSPSPPNTTINPEPPASPPAPPQTSPQGTGSPISAEPPVTATNGPEAAGPSRKTSAASSNSSPSPSLNSPPSTFQKGGPRLELNNLLADPLRQAIEYRPQAVLSASGHPAAWTVELLVFGISLGTGTASRKDAAKDIAAQEGLNRLGQPGVLESLRAQAR